MDKRITKLVRLLLMAILMVCVAYMIHSSKKVVIKEVHALEQVNTKAETMKIRNHYVTKIKSVEDIDFKDKVKAELEIYKITDDKKSTISNVKTKCERVFNSLIPKKEIVEEKEEVIEEVVSTPSLTINAPEGEAKTAFLELIREHGISDSDALTWAEIIRRESGWQINATNPESGAYGLPQSLPAHKMASAGADWQTNAKTQLRWMLSYMNERYGSISNAMEFWNQNHWY